MSTVFPLTDEQRTAITTVGRSVIVSAAAGSGKTTVLAERCAYLVCDAPENERCDVDRLLVLTFTEAAAAEMRSRIVEAIRRRCEARPHDHRLQQQLALADIAQISTIHGFCLWVIRRWFDQAGIDPMASVLDAEEASVLKKEVLDGLFERLYSVSSKGGALLGEDLLHVDPDESQTAPGAEIPGFVRLIDVYGLGQDRDIGRFVLKLYEFTTSLPDPVGWLHEAIEKLDPNCLELFSALRRELQIEIQMQIPHVEMLAAAIESGDPCGHDYARLVRLYVEALQDWRTIAESASTPAEALDQIGSRIRVFEFGNATTLRKLTEVQRVARDAAKDLSQEAKNLFKKRVHERFGFFSNDEWAAGLREITPHVRTIVALVQAFSTAYKARKQRLNVMDFSDLERVAFGLVCRGADTASPVAAALRDRYAHVLVDEFQDINPIQKEIIEAVSREGDSERPKNLFSVGDVKQSIYRFRLAEPEIFLDRLRRLSDGKAATSVPNAEGDALFLQSNFRSRREILDLVNLLFRRLMSGPGEGLVYDEKAELRSGKPATEMEGHIPVELHLLERRMTPSAAASDGTNDSSTDDDPDSSPDKPAEAEGLDRGIRRGEPPSRWAAIAREAYLVATQIQAMVSGSPPAQRPVRYADIAILLRSTKINADEVAGVLSSMGIPAYAQAGGSLMGSREVRDVVAALQVLDNFQQDIPLAGTLRSGIFGDRFNEDELVAMRLHDRAAPFHQAVRGYAVNGGDQSLRERLHALLQRIQNFREEVTRRPLAQTVWNLLERQGYFAYVSGLPNGAQRRANLLKLYDLARRFSTSRRQGLHRFLRLIESLSDEDKPISTASPGPEGEDVVRIMSIHHAKGMEFPVVFVIGLGTKFNLGDRNGRMIFERKSRIGLRAIDTLRMVEYPTLTHQLVASEVERSTREEELRILYVAMTRAKQRLILVGTMDQVEHGVNARDKSTRQATALRIATARTPLDWIIPVLSNAPNGAVRGLGGTATHPTLTVTLHLPDEMQNWSLESTFDRDQVILQEAVSRFEPLPAGEPVLVGDAEVERTLRRMNHVYPWLGASSVEATLAASKLRRDDEFSDRRNSFRARSTKLDDSDATDGFERGTLTHRALQYLDFQKATDAASVASELGRMVSEGIFKESERETILEDGIAWFVGTPLAQTIRNAGTNYHREFRFVTAEPLSDVDPTVVAAPEDRVLVRGIVDGIVVRSGECEIVDFKTDAISAAQAAAQSDKYRPVVELYARATERLWRRPVRNCRLVFLAANCVVDVQVGIGQTIP